MAFTKEQHKAHREKMRALGLCVRCHKAKTSGGGVCDKCKAVFAARSKYRRENGLCRDCGVPNDDPAKMLCVNCGRIGSERRYWARQKI